MAKRYDQYCPVAHALDLIGERWSLLIVKELMHGPKRYTDLVEHLPGIGTNILAGRLRDLETAGVVAKRTLPPPAPAKVYELTDYGRDLRPVMRELALWGARSLGPPTRKEDLYEGWLANAVETMLARSAPPGRIELHCAGEVASIVDGRVEPGPVDDPDVVAEAAPLGMYRLLIEHRLDGVRTTGDRELLERLVAAAAPERLPAPV